MSRGLNCHGRLNMRVETQPNGYLPAQKIVSIPSFADLVEPLQQNHASSRPASIPAIALDSYFHTAGSGSTIPDPGAVEENGRTYHGYKDGKYLLPNDGTEQDRLDLQHSAWSCFMGGALAWAPFRDPPRRVLDVGTGTGIWALEFADRYPSAAVVGTDLSRIQPWGRHPNVTWVQEDAEDDWVPFPGGGLFDYVHLRMMVTCFDDPRAVMRKAYDHLCPGGWIEYQDQGVDILCQDTSTLGTSIHRWLFMLRDGAKRLGRDLDSTQHYKNWLVEVGFTDVKEVVIRVPANPWPDDPELKNVGRWSLSGSIQGVEAVSLRILGKGLGMPVSEILQLVAQVKKDLSNRKHRFYWTMRVVYGQKPF
ncbi:hypothetical protein LQW54_004705 [Pestalotiopsis sp. IQ-011]